MDYLIGPENHESVNEHRPGEGACIYVFGLHFEKPAA